MENRKIRYRLPIVLFLACLVVNVVAAHYNHAYPVYFGGEVKNGKFSVSCIVHVQRGPIEWHQDGRPIESQKFINPPENGSYYESTITVTNANIRHKGKYHCIKDDSVYREVKIDEDSSSVETEIQIVNKYKIDGEQILNEFTTPKIEQQFTEFNTKLDLDESSEDDYSDRPINLIESMTSTIDSSSNNFEISENNNENNNKIHEEDFVDKFEEEDDVEETTIKMEISPPITLTVSTTTENAIIEMTSFPFTSTVLIESVTTSSGLATTTTTISDEELSQTPLSIKNQDELKRTRPDKDEVVWMKNGETLTLACSYDGPEANKAIKWKRVMPEKDKDHKENNKETGKTKEVEIKDLKDPEKYIIKQAEGSLTIKKFLESHSGEYICYTPTKSLKFTVHAFPRLKMDSELFAVEDEKLELKCIIYGSMIKEDEIHWYYENDTTTETEIPEDSGITIENDASHSAFIISKLSKEKTSLQDKGSYVCQVLNNNIPKRESSDEFRAKGNLYVKDKFAALWPFLGICAEVFILCAIILIYEKRRNKTEQDDSDTDQPDQKLDHRK